MPSSTVDLMLVQVTGFMVAVVGLVLWLWIADVRRWWPFDSGDRIQMLFEHHVGFEAVRMLATTALERAYVGVTTVTSAAVRAPSDGLRCGARRPLRTVAMSARAESRDDVHARACSRRSRVAGPVVPTRSHPLAPRHDGAVSGVTVHPRHCSLRLSRVSTRSANASSIVVAGKSEKPSMRSVTPALW